MPKRLFALFALLLFAVTGCSASSQYMHEVKTPMPQARPDAATVIFMRPSSYASALTTTIFDERGRFYGDSLPESYFAVSVEPGEHIFISWAENTGALRASLAAGRIYFVEVAPKVGVLSARVHLLAITPQRESWGKLREWLGSSKHLEPDLAGGQRYLNGRNEDVTERIRRAYDAVQNYSVEERAERTLRPEDGAQ
jgi:hypothetical protein